MNVELKKSANTMRIINLLAGIGPLAILAPFAVLTGFLDFGNVLYLVSNPAPILAILGLVLLGQLMAMMTIRASNKVVESPNVDWNAMSRLTKLAAYQPFVYVFVESLGSGLVVRYLSDVDFPRKGLLTFLFVLAFQMMVTVPQVSILTVRLGKLFRSVNQNPDVSTPIHAKVNTLLVSTFLGITLMFITIQVISAINTEIGSIPPVSPVFTAILAGVVALATVLLGLRVLLNSIFRPIGSMVDTFSAAADGDFRSRLTASSADEIGRMSLLSNQLITSLNDGFGSIRTTVGSLQSSKDDLSLHVEELAGSVEQIRQNLLATNNQMEDHSSNVLETTAAVEQMARNIESLGNHIRQQVEVVTDSSRSISELSEANTRLTELAERSKEKTVGLKLVSRESEEQLQAMTERIKAIMESSRHLMEANEMIASVASQTNLLAMNAAIEAAHAGDAGRGFAVVADEIRKLAETSSNQSSNISTNLKEVIADIERVGEESQTMQSSFGQINSHVNDVDEAVEHLNSFTGEVKSFSEKLEEAMGSLNTVSESVAMGSREMQAGNQEILNAIANMREISQKVLEAINEITVGADEITSLSGGMLNQNRLTDESLEQVTRVLAKFRTRD